MVHCQLNKKNSIKTDPPLVADIEIKTGLITETLQITKKNRRFFFVLLYLISLQLRFVIMVLVNCPLKEIHAQSIHQSATVLFYNVNPELTDDDLRVLLEPVTGRLENVVRTKNGAVLIRVPCEKDAYALKVCFDGVVYGNSPIYAEVILHETVGNLPTRSGMNSITPTRPKDARKDEITREELNEELEQYMAHRRQFKK